METLEKGKFFGTSRKQFQLNGLTIVDSEFYNYSDCPWHYHENPHFAFTTGGTLLETHKSGTIQLSPGCLLYNHSQEPHCNSGYSDMVSALHIDIDISWFKNYQVNHSLIAGLTEVKNPLLKNLFYKIFKEVKYPDTASCFSIETLVLQSVNEMLRSNQVQGSGKPGWFFKIKDLLYNNYNENLSLKEIASEINLHPVYLCQQFPAYFKCNLGDYIRKIKIEKSVELILRNPQLSLTAVGYDCGFYDQSHFISVFKKQIGVTPLAFKKMVKRR